MSNMTGDIAIIANIKSANKTQPTSLRNFNFLLLVLKCNGIINMIFAPYTAHRQVAVCLATTSQILFGYRSLEALNYTYPCKFVKY